jgi:hypothetical protein
VSRGNRSTTLANLVLAVQDLGGSPEPVVTGTLDGTPITLFSRTGTTAAFDEGVSAALGLSDLRSNGGAVAAHFAKTVLPG